MVTGHQAFRSTPADSAGFASVDPHSLYRQACTHPEGAAGFYNRNIRVAAGTRAVNVRIPVEGADLMDYRQWPEPQVLAAIAPHIAAVPVLSWESARPAYQIHEYIDGDVLDQLAPRGHPVPAHVPSDVAQLFAQLRAIPRSALPPTPGGLDDDPQRFARRLWGVTRQAYLDRRWGHSRLFRRLRIPADPFEPLVGTWNALRPRPFRLIHADLHRKNMIVRNGETVFLDWELALYGDPLYDVAIHLHKMRYLPDEQERFVSAWAAAEPEAAHSEWEHDLQIYLVHEQIKSAVLDAVRYAKLIAEGGLTPDNQQFLVRKLAQKLQAAASVWGLEAPIGEVQVEAALRGGC
ncbi:phosphotransferase family protein [Nocardia transvalensis]|uniref:phosphotransferase family protein n=1 Tax=Nocardia transvalensis TaxID=37333 RepID=UPI001893FFF2|nr:aminoglycoside phosphotransferase family protein [Nocardia transvalensis]MBF6331866.1 aminoglycoside phosphotransferase family protein [Nocardia transvalensis]